MTASDSGASRIDRDDSSTGSGHPRDDQGLSDSTRTRPQRADEHRTTIKPAKTSAAAVFALVFGLSALLSVLTVLLAPLAILLAVIGIVLGIVGIRMAKRVGVTGKGVAIGGLALSVVALLLAATVAISVTTFLNNDSAVNRLEKQVQRMRDDLPAKVEVPTP